MKQIPYGIADFERIIRQDYYYVDKSEYIRTVEDQNAYILLVRPRRMGKSLFTSMLQAYYDINQKQCFEDLFGKLAISKNPTSWANKFITLKLDFSHIKKELGQLEASFTEYCFRRLNQFFEQYNQFYTPEDREWIMSATSVKEAFISLVEKTHYKGLPIYLFIDEYDNFTNAVLSARGIKAHEEITHGQGFYRDFFQGCKDTFDRIFMTGVTPTSYDDLTSGFSIADNVALNPLFNNVIGLTEVELRQIIEYYRGEGKITLSTDEIIAEIKPWYDNFCFSSRCFGSQPSIYNTSMVLKYLKSLITIGMSPESMIDNSVRTDSDKLNYLVMAEDLGYRKERFNIIQEICAHGYTNGNVEDQFPASDAGKEKNFKSMLFYYGTLTFGGHDEYGAQRLVVPNKTMGELYLSYMLQCVEEQGFSLNGKRKELDLSVREAAVKGCWENMVGKIGEICNDYSSIFNNVAGEYDIQGFIRGLLCLNSFFEIWPELELNHGRGDILLIPKGIASCPTQYSYLLELKNMKSDEKDVQKYIDEACLQLKQYIADNHLHESPLLRGTSLTPLYLVFRNHQLVASGECEIL